MQFLIDLITERVIQSVGFVDRGCTTLPDWRLVDFITDGASHVLDISSIVPSNARAVLFGLVINAPPIPPQFAIFFPTACTVSASGYTAQSFSANRDENHQPIVQVDAAQSIKYLMSNVAWNRMDLRVRGWWLRGIPE